MSDTILATASASQPRRWFGVVTLMMIGSINLYLGLATAPSLGWRIFLLLLGGGMVFGAMRFLSATQRRLELTAEVLRDSSGVVLAQTQDIVGVDRGMLAFKPSNGFLMKTRTPLGRCWQPGLYWRLGRRVGIGGVTPAAQTKLMSETILAMIARREQD